MANDVKFEGKERRMAKISACLADNGIDSLEAARDLACPKASMWTQSSRGVQPIAFENARVGLHPRRRPGAQKGRQDRCAGRRHHWRGLAGILYPRLGGRADGASALATATSALCCWRMTTKCFCFLAGHESFAAAEGAIGIARTANKVRKEPLRVILNGLGKDAAYIISRINGFTYVKTDYDFYTGELKIVEERAFSDGEKAKVRCYGANDVLEGVAVMKQEGVDVSITGNSHQSHTVSSIWSPALIKNGRLRMGRSISRSHRAAAQAAPCTPTTWQPAPLPMA